MYLDLGKKFDKYKDFMVFEIESHEQIKIGLEKEVQNREDYIEELKVALSIPRQHYKYIENKSADEIIEQKNQIVQNMSNTMGVPPEKLLDMLYKKEAAKKAKLEVTKGLQEEDDGDAPVVKDTPKEEVKEEKKTLGADASQKTVGAEKKKGGEILSGSPKL